MAKKQSILVVEDETDLAEMVRYNLEREGFACRLAGRSGANPRTGASPHRSPLEAQGQANPCVGRSFDWALLLRSPMGCGSLLSVHAKATGQPVDSGPGGGNQTAGEGLGNPVGGQKTFRGLYNAWVPASFLSAG